jgi:hypothetical protein
LQPNVLHEESRHDEGRAMVRETRASARPAAAAVEEQGAGAGGGIADRRRGRRPDGALLLPAHTHHPLPAAGCQGAQHGVAGAVVRGEEGRSQSPLRA